MSEAIQAISLASIPAAYWMGALSIHWMYANAFVLGVSSVVGTVAEHYSIRTGMACVAAGGVALTIALLMSKPIRAVRP